MVAIDLVLGYDVMGVFWNDGTFMPSFNYYTTVVEEESVSVYRSLVYDFNMGSYRSINYKCHLL